MSPLQQGGPIADQCEVKLGIFYPVVPEVGIPFRRSWRSTTTGYAVGHGAQAARFRARMGCSAALGIYMTRQPGTLVEARPSA